MNDTLENLIDQTSLGRVVDALAEVCRDKAEHLTTNWQDQATARQWTRAAGVLAKALDKLPLGI